MAEKKKLSLEESMSRLEEIVSELENEKLPLDRSLELYKEGVKLAADCSKELEDAKRTIKILQSGADGEIVISDVPDGTFAEE